MTDVFLSYATADRDAARRLADSLGQLGYGVWWDRNIPPGRQFDEVIQEALEAARCVIVLWSAQSVRSNWVKTEATEALALGKLVPALIDVVPPPMEFKRIQAADLSRWSGDAEDPQYLALVGSIQRLMQAGSRVAAADEGLQQPREARPAAPGASRWRAAGVARMRHPAVWAAAITAVTLSAFVIFSVLANGGAGTSHTGSAIQSAGDAAGSESAEPTSGQAGGTSPASAVPSRQDKRINLLAPEAGGQLVVASSEGWSRVADAKEDTYFDAWPAAEAVFEFQDGRRATFDTFAVLIPSSSRFNPREVELLAGNDTPTGHFDSIGVFTTQNLRVMKNPFQAFRFPRVKAKYLKIRALSSHGGLTNWFYEIALFGTLE